MLTITLAQLKADITPKLKGTSLRQISDFYSVAAGAANRMLGRIDPEETRRTITMSSPFFDNVQDYSLVSDFKRGIDIRPTANRQSLPGLSHFEQTSPRQFNENLDSNSFSVKWNNMVRSLRSQRLPAGNVATMDTFDSVTSNGTWTAEGDASPSNINLGTATITIATPAVITLSSHGLLLGDVVQFTTSGLLPTGIVVSTSYYVISQGLTANTFEISATVGGAAINTSGSQSGTHTLFKVPVSLYSETLNYVEGSAALGMNLSGSTGAADIVNSTAAPTDLSLLRYQDSSLLFYYIPVGFSSRFTSFNLRRGSSATAYKSVTVTTKADGTAFTDGWNFLKFDWNSASTVGNPDDTKNTYRRFGIIYSAGTSINGCLIDNWTDSLGTLYEVEYYSEYMFRTAAGVWLAVPTADTDLVNVGTLSYEILKAEMMIDITQEIRTGPTRSAELADWRMMLNGQPPNRYIKDPQYRGMYADYSLKFPSSAIVTQTRTYNFDV